jgi:hypothetical protein
MPAVRYENKGNPAMGAPAAVCSCARACVRARVLHARRWFFKR